MYKVKEDFVRNTKLLKEAKIHNSIILTGPFKSIMARLLENDGVEPKKILGNGSSHENQVQHIANQVIECRVLDNPEEAVPERIQTENQQVSESLNG